MRLAAEAAPLSRARLPRLCLFASIRPLRAAEKAHGNLKSSESEEKSIGIDVPTGTEVLVGHRIRINLEAKGRRGQSQAPNGPKMP